MGENHNIFDILNILNIYLYLIFRKDADLNRVGLCTKPGSDPDSIKID